MKENPLSNLWVIELSNSSLGLKTICGFCDYWQTFDSGTICQIAVHPDLQGYKLGSQMMEEIIKDAKIKKIRSLYPEANIVAIDYDPGASHTNQVNRIKLMLTVAKENLKKNSE